MTFAVNIAQSGSNNQTMRNRIINGGMVIDQRNAGATVTPSNETVTYITDRFAFIRSSSTSPTLRQSTDAPPGFTNSLLFTNAASGTTPEYAQVYQNIEGFNSSDFAWGTANAQPVTVSFWVKSSLTGTFSVAIRNSASNRSYVSTYTISSANTWEYKTVTIPGDTSGTWLTNNGIGINLVFRFGASSGTSSINQWTATGNAFATGSVNVMGTANATFQITGVQLEEGTAASPFEYRLYGQELSLCRRYFARYFQNTGGLAGDSAVFNMANWNGTEAYGANWFQVSMRAAPSFSFSSLTDFTWYASSATRIPTAIDQQGASVDRCEMKVQWSSSISTGTAGWLRIGGSANNGWIQWSAEL